MQRRTHTDRIPQPDRTSSNLRPPFLLYLLYRLISSSLTFSSSLPTSFHSLSIHQPSFPPSSSHPPVGVFVMEQQEWFPCFFSPLGYLYRGVGGWEFLPESRTEGILCWSEGQREGGEKERVGWVGTIRGGGENATDTGKSFVCRYQNQVQESGAHTGFHIHVMVKKECNWG